MVQYSHLPYDKVVQFDQEGEAGKWEIDFVKDPDGLGIVAKSLYIENTALAGTITVELSADGQNNGRTVTLEPGARRSYDIPDCVRIWKVSAYASVAGAELSIGATPGEWTDDEWEEYLAKMGAVQ